MTERRRSIKRTLIEEHGGCCDLCGYDRCERSLTFHHRDPSQRAFTIAANATIIGIDQLRQEAAKCVLLCANCHGEVEAGLAKVSPPSDTGSKG